MSRLSSLQETFDGLSSFQKHITLTLGRVSIILGTLTTIDNKSTGGLNRQFFYIWTQSIYGKIALSESIFIFTPWSKNKNSFYDVNFSIYGRSPYMGKLLFLSQFLFLLHGVKIKIASMMSIFLYMDAVHIWENCSF